MSGLITRVKCDCGHIIVHDTSSGTFLDVGSVLTCGACGARHEAVWADLVWRRVAVKGGAA